MTGLAIHAESLDRAAQEARAIPQITNANPALTVADAYQIQKLSVERRRARGEKRIGVKMGLTSRAKMLQVGVDQVTWGRLTDAMLLVEGSALSLSRYVHPRIEPEIAFLMNAPLSAKATAAEALKLGQWIRNTVQNLGSVSIRVEP